MPELICRKIIQQADNEFVVEFDTKKDTSQVAEGKEFEYNNARYRVKRALPGMEGGAVYSFLVITEVLHSP